MSWQEGYKEWRVLLCGKMNLSGVIRWTLVFYLILAHALPDLLMINIQPRRETSKVHEKEEKFECAFLIMGNLLNNSLTSVANQAVYEDHKTDVFTQNQFISTIIFTKFQIVLAICSAQNVKEASSCQIMTMIKSCQFGL